MRYLLGKGLCIFAAIAAIALFTATPAQAWEGYDYENNANVEIEKGNLVRSGRDIEVYDYEKGEYREMEVQDINRNGRTVEIEVYDYESGEYRTLEMED